MGKRSEFPRVAKDLYETWDPRAVAPLLPHLKPHTQFVEPCAGNLALVRQLEAAGHVAAWVSDIEGRDVTYTVSGVPVTRKVQAYDVFKLTQILRVAGCVITNCPWSRPILHKMIEHFISHANETWLLLDAGWAFTKQSADYMPHCSDIVAVGRVRWVPDTKMVGKDDCAWYRFSTDTEYTIFHPRIITPATSKAP